MIILTYICYLFLNFYKKLLTIKFSLVPIFLGLFITFIWITLPLPQTSDLDLNSFLTIDLTYAYLWIAIKVIGSCLLIPIVEEVAFRGFLLRFLIQRKFEQVPQGTFQFGSCFITALIFGLLHQHLWAGILTGIILNLSLYYRKSLFDSIICHSTANAALAFYIIYTSHWQYWL